MDDRQLRWEQQSKAVRQRDARAGDVARECVQALGRGGPAWRQRLIGVLYDEVGFDLLDHAEPASISRGVLTFRVTEAAMVYHLRIQWEQRLLQLLAARLPQAGIHSIRFSAGVA